MTKSFLGNNKISYQDLNVAEDKAAVIDIDGELVIGFDEAQLKAKLGL